MRVSVQRKERKESLGTERRKLHGTGHWSVCALVRLRVHVGECACLKVFQ